MYAYAEHVFVLRSIAKVDTQATCARETSPFYILLRPNSLNRPIKCTSTPQLEPSAAGLSHRRRIMATSRVKPIMEYS